MLKILKYQSWLCITHSSKWFCSFLFIAFLFFLVSLSHSSIGVPFTFQSSFPGILISGSAPGGTQTMTVTMLLYLSANHLGLCLLDCSAWWRHNHHWEWYHVSIDHDTWEEESHCSTPISKRLGSTLVSHEIDIKGGAGLCFSPPE